MNSKKLVISATDTDAGKTATVAGLALAAHKQGLRPLIVKPVQTGCRRNAQGELEAPDLATCLEAVPEAAARALELFEPACSPHLAARRIGKELSVRGLADATLAALREIPADIALLEGAGGLLTPINEQETLADLFSSLGWPIVMVAPNRLGAINHALLTLECARGRGLPIAGFILARANPPTDPETAAILNDNADAIQRMSGVPCLADVPHCTELRDGDVERRKKGWSRLADVLAPVLKVL